jgi:hypothetical protein
VVNGCAHYCRVVGVPKDEHLLCNLAPREGEKQVDILSPPLPSWGYEELRFWVDINCDEKN